MNTDEGKKIDESRTNQEDLAAFIVTEITCSPGSLEGRQRCPRKVGRLLGRIVDLDLDEAISLLRGDSSLLAALSMIKAHHCYKWTKRGGRWEEDVDEAGVRYTWGLVKGKLAEFRDQFGGQQLIPKEALIPFFQGLKEDLQKYADQAKDAEKAAKRGY